MVCIVPVVEGPGDRDAVPILLRRLLSERLKRYDVSIARPKCANGKSKLIRDLEKFIEYSLITPGCKAVLILLDADKECPKKLAESLTQKIVARGFNVPIAVVCANQEYETWIIANLDTNKGEEIRNRLGLSSSVECSGAVESIGSAKGWLTKQMSPGRIYKETTHEAPLTQLIDLDVVYSRSRSFRRMCHAMEELVLAIDRGSVITTPKP